MNTGGLKVRSFINAGLLLLSVAGLTSCSDGSIGVGGPGGGGGIVVAEGGISGTGISSGSISGFSSVILNGTKLEVTAETQIFVDGQPGAAQADLKVGYVIRVEADFDNGVAERIDYVETVLGPVTAMPVFNPDTLAGSMEVLGQTVLTNSITKFDGLDPSTLIGGELLEVSGIRNAAGDIVARYIGQKAGEDKYRVLGPVSELGATPQTFKIGNLTVNYPGTELQNGDQVRVVADVSTFNSTTPELTADSVTPSTLEVVLSSGDSLELEGIVTKFVSLSDFKVNDLSVDATDAIASGAIENGSEGDIKAGALIEVEGSVNESAVLIASKIKIVPLSNIRVESTVDSVDLENRSLVVVGIPNTAFFVDDRTQFEDDSAQPVANFSLDDVSPSNRVELRAFRKDGRLIITRLEREETDTGVRIQGPVENIDMDAKTLAVLGITIFSDDFTTEFEMSDDTPFPTQQAFFDALTDTDVVKAQWDSFTATSVVVDELSIEDESLE